MNNFKSSKEFNTKDEIKNSLDIWQVESLVREGYAKWIGTEKVVAIDNPNKDFFDNRLFSKWAEMPLDQLYTIVENLIVNQDKRSKADLVQMLKFVLMMWSNAEAVKFIYRQFYESFREDISRSLEKAEEL